MELIGRYGIGDMTLRLNSIGDATCRPHYREALLAHFRPVAGKLSEDSQRRLERNPLRILDSKAAEDRPHIESAPTFLDTLCEPCLEHFSEVRGYLDALDLPYVVDPKIVRGFDYYTRTVFEIVSPSLGAQSALCGGGRYDELVASLGGPATPAVGFGLGEERFLMIAPDKDAEPPRSGFQAIALGDAARAWLVPVVGALRSSAGPPVHMDYQTRLDRGAFSDRRPEFGALGADRRRRRAGQGRDRAAGFGRARRAPDHGGRGRRGNRRGGAGRRRRGSVMDEAERIEKLAEILNEFDLDAIKIRIGEDEIEIVRRSTPPMVTVAAGCWSGDFRARLSRRLPAAGRLHRRT